METICGAKLQKIKLWLNAKIFPVLHPVIFSKGRHLEGLFSFNFETTHLKNNFDTNLVKLFSGY